MTAVNQKNLENNELYSKFALPKSKLNVILYNEILNQVYEYIVNEDTFQGVDIPSSFEVHICVLELHVATSIA